MLKYLNHLGDLVDLIEDTVDILQQFRYNNEQEAKSKLLKVSVACARIYNEMNNDLTASSNGESDP